MKLKIFRKTEDAKIPTTAYMTEQGEQTSAGWDLYSTADVVIPARGSAMVPNDIHIEVPEGYYFDFNTRSGHGIKKGLRVHPGIVDHGYTGELAVKMFNLSDQDVVIEKGEKYVQIIFHKVNPVSFGEVDETEWKKYEESCVRGSNGFGSSGK